MTIAGLILSNSQIHSALGRHLFPALVAFAVLCALGIDTLARRSKVLRPAAWLGCVSGCLLAANFAGLILFATGAGDL